MNTIEKVDDEKSFLKFLKLLSDDWGASDQAEQKSPSNPYGPTAFGWENCTIGDFLESACAFGESTTGNPEFQRKNVWRRAAEIIYAGKIYE